MWKADQIRTLQTVMTEVGYKDPKFLYDIEAVAFQYNYFSLIQSRVPTAKQVMFVDVGYSHSSVTCVRYSSTKPRLYFLSCCYSESCCGRIFDRILTELLEEKLSSTDVDMIHNNPQLMAMIRSNCEKSKCILSSECVESISIQVPGMCGMEEKTVEIKKEEWNERCRIYGVFRVLEMMCSKCLAVGADVEHET